MEEGLTMAFIAAGAAIAGLGSSIVSGEQGRKQQKKALRSQEQAQARSEARALSQQRRSEQEQRRLNPWRRQRLQDPRTSRSGFPALWKNR